MNETKERLLISMCLLGTACRYDGRSVPLDAETIAALAARYELIPVCPEQLGGLATPRAPAERRGGAVVTECGTDVTAQYVRGAGEALRLAQLFSCRRALLKERSPSCGRGQIYDGTFSRTLVSGSGVAAGLLEENSLAVYGESEVEKLL